MHKLKLNFWLLTWMVSKLTFSWTGACSEAWLVVAADSLFLLLGQRHDLNWSFSLSVILAGIVQICCYSFLE